MTCPGPDYCWGIDHAWCDTEAVAAWTACGWYVGPVPRLDGETFTCVLPQDHLPPHEAEDGTWFEECGHPPEPDPLQQINDYYNKEDS